MLQYLELFLCGALLLTLVKEFKHQETGIPSTLVFEDYWLLWLMTAAVFAVSHLGNPVAGAVVLAAVLLAVFVLWLDALLFRLFGVELEPTGIRRYCVEIFGGFAEERKHFLSFLPRSSFTLLPAIAAAALLAFYRRDLAAPLLAPLLLYFVIRTRHMTGARHVPWGLAAALAACLLAQLLADGAWPSPRPIETLAAAVLLALGARLVASTSWAGGRPFFNLPTYLRHFVSGRAFADDPGFVVREEHAHLFRQGPAPARRSDHHGRLAGANVLLVTLEGVARDHLSLFRGGGPVIPCLEQLAARSVVSHNHFCISPQTTNSHRAIYSADYPAGEVFPFLEALRDAGYRTAYLSPADTRYFGLGELVRQAGFDPLLDEAAFTPHAMDPGQVSDYVLMDQGVRRIRELAEQPGPFFVHVQTRNTHKNYRVVDTARFHRWQERGELARYFNCLEEMDWILGELLHRLEEPGILDDTLVIITADHGQAFGDFGYHGHSNTVIRQEVNVPFLMTHPKLEAASVTYSTHFDILPTVLDLLGLACPAPCSGAPIFLDARVPFLLLYSETMRAGVASSSALIDGDRKYMVDLVFGKSYEMEWDDTIVRRLAGGEKAYFSQLLHRLLAARGLPRT